MIKKVKVKIPDFSNFIKRLSDLIPKEDIEKFVFKTLLGIWLLILITAATLKATLAPRYDIEEKIIGAVTAVKPQTKREAGMGKYEAMLALAKSPEEIEKYLPAAGRDTFSEYKVIVAETSSGKQEYDFVLTSINKVALPMVYKGYIELPDRIIGQVNWREATRFVEASSMLDGYKIRSVSKEKIDALNENGENIEFQLNKPVLGDELQAVLYDNLSKRSFNVQTSTEIGEYKVIDITPNYVILHFRGTEINLAIKN